LANRVSRKLPPGTISESLKLGPVNTGILDHTTIWRYHPCMETRIIKLEEFAEEARDRLARIESRLDHMATKEDVSKLESTLLRCFIGTAISLTALAFTAAKLIH
jgi:hypothetical protein